MKKEQPVYLNLYKITLPVTGIVSLLHRVSGLLLVFAIPVALYLLQLSLLDSAGYEQAKSLLEHPLVRFIKIFFYTLLVFHLLAGIRFLLMDIELGVSKKMANITSRLVILITLVVMLLFVALEVLI